MPAGGLFGQEIPIGDTCGAGDAGDERNEGGSEQRANGATQVGSRGLLGGKSRCQVSRFDSE